MPSLLQRSQGVVRRAQCVVYRLFHMSAVFLTGIALNVLALRLARGTVP